MSSFKTIHSRIEWELTLKTESPLHIGTNHKDSGSDIFPLTDAEDFDNANYMIIPGSSLKGRCKNFIEEVAVQQELPLQKLIDDLFGHTKGTGLKGRVWFGDSRVWFGDSKVNKKRLTIKYITPIGRLTQMPNATLKIRAIRHGTEFTVKFAIENPSDMDLSLAAFFLRALYEGHVSIGASSARGLGRVNLLQASVHLLLTSREASQEEQRRYSLSNWKTEFSYLGMAYSRVDKGNEMYQWMQSSVIELQKMMTKEMISS